MLRVTRIGVRELRQYASQYLAKVKAGESVEVTERGRLIALIVPVSPGMSVRERLIAEGKLIAAQSPQTLYAPLLEADEQPPSSVLLDETREERFE